jgi:pimeloyl-ACP methyl ester carboxylesterase
MGRRTAAGREPASRLVRFEATDGVPLAGVLFEPHGRRASARPLIVWLHGTGGASVFESQRTNLLGAAFAARGIAFFPFNNRGAQIVRRAGERLGGAAFERIRDCVFDIDGALRELRRRGYRKIFLAGHSTGANKVAVYDRLEPRNRVKGYVLLGGADDTGLMLQELGARRFRTTLERARAMIRARRGDELMPRRLMTWRAFHDMANPDGDYNVFPFDARVRGRRPFRVVRGIRKPSLYIYGDRDEYRPDVAQLAQQVGPGAEIVVLRDTDHGFTGREEELAELIAQWIFRSAALR